MTKFPIPIAHEIRPGRRKAKRWQVISILFVCVVVAPLVTEGAMICYGQWCEVIGTPTAVSTPLLDTMGNSLGIANEWFGDRIAPVLQRMVRNPRVALPISSILIIAAISMLRR